MKRCAWGGVRGRRPKTAEPPKTPHHAHNHIPLPECPRPVYLSTFSLPVCFCGRSVLEEVARPQFCASFADCASHRDFAAHRGHLVDVFGAAQFVWTPWPCDVHLVLSSATQRCRPDSDGYPVHRHRELLERVGCLFFLITISFAAAAVAFDNLLDGFGRRFVSARRFIRPPV